MDDRERVEEYMKEDYLPTSPTPEAQDRIANALEYIAYHIGRIDKRLTGIHAALNK